MLSMWNCVAMCHSSVVEIGSEARQHGGFATISGVKGGTLMMLPGCGGQLVKEVPRGRGRGGARRRVNTTMTWGEVLDFVGRRSWGGEAPTS